MSVEEPSEGVPVECGDEVSGLHCILPAGHADKHEQPGPMADEVMRWSEGGADFEIVDRDPPTAEVA